MENTDEIQTEMGIEEGTEILDPETKAKADLMKEVNADVTAMLAELQVKYSIKLMLLGLHPEMNQMGIWKTKNLTTLDELGFAKLCENQF